VEHFQGNLVFVQLLRFALNPRLAEITEKSALLFRSDKVLALEQDFNFTTDFLRGDRGLFYFGHGYAGLQNRVETDADASTFRFSVQSIVGAPSDRPSDTPKAINLFLTTLQLIERKCRDLRSELITVSIL